MNPRDPRSSSVVASLVGIAGVVILGAGAFAYTAGWLSPNRLTASKLVEALAPPGGPALGHRRNHAKGVCFTGFFEANGNGSEISTSQIFSSGRYPVIGRFNLGSPDLNAADPTVRIRGLGLQITAPDGEVWRSAMIDAPFFAVTDPEAFYALLLASGSKDPNAFKTFAAEHPEIMAFVSWTKSSPWTASFAEESYNSLNSFFFRDKKGERHALRWSYRPQSKVTPLSQAEFATLGPNYLEGEIAKRVAEAPQRWDLILTVADTGDQTADPSKAWPDDRRTIDAGVLIVSKIEPEADGPCRDINFDPTILPDGATVSDDPFPAARSAAYAISYDARTAEAKYYPHAQTGSRP